MFRCFEASCGFHVVNSFLKEELAASCLLLAVSMRVWCVWYRVLDSFCTALLTSACTQYRDSLTDSFHLFLACVFNRREFRAPSHLTNDV